jgi:hypothetical protein
MIHVPPTTESLVIDVPVGAGRSYYAARIAAMLRGEPARKPPKPPTLATVAKQAGKAGIEVARYEVRLDGTVVVVTGTGEQQQGTEVDEWIAKHARKTQRH